MNSSNAFYGDQTACSGNEVLLAIRKVGTRLSASCAVPGGAWLPINVTITGYVPQIGNSNLVITLFANSTDGNSITAQFSDLTIRRF